MLCRISKVRLQYPLVSANNLDGKGKTIMLTIATIAAIVGLYALLKAKNNFDRIFSTLMNATAAGVVAFFIVWFISFAPGLGSKDMVVEETNVELVASNTTASLQGSFFLVAGTIEQKFYYLYYWKDDAGGIHFDK